MSATEPVADLVHGGEAERWGGLSWSEPRDGEHFQRCSYCGSMHPDAVAAEAGARLDWADWKYGWPHKFYLHVPNRDPERLYAISVANHDPGEGEYLPYSGLSEEQKAIVRDGGWGVEDEQMERWIWFGTRPEHFGKFYTRHLADPAISGETKTAIAQMSGLTVWFAEGQIHWGPA